MEFNETISSSVIPMLPHTNIEKHEKKLKSDKQIESAINKQVVESASKDEDIQRLFGGILDFQFQFTEADESIDDDNIEEDKDSDNQESKSLPKKTDEHESDKNGVVRKQLYIAFIEYAKGVNGKNVFSSVFDQDIFHITYPWIPDEMRYFYRISNPLLCVLNNSLTFFELSELRTINQNKDTRENLFVVFAADKDDHVIAFKREDKKIYNGIIEGENITLKNEEAPSFDEFIQKIVGRDFLGTGIVSTPIFNGLSISNTGDEEVPEEQPTGDTNDTNGDNNGQQSQQNADRNIYSTATSTVPNKPEVTTKGNPPAEETAKENEEDDNEPPDISNVGESVNMFESVMFGKK